MKYLFFLFNIFSMQIILCSPTATTSGGTGNTFANAFAVICAGTTTIGNLQSLASVGTSGQALVSSGAASLPAFGTVPISSGGTNTTSIATGVVESNGTALTSLGFGSANQVLKNTSGVVGWSFTGLLQIVSTSTSARINTTGTTIPNDDTIPQIGEGTSILSLAITPKSASSNLLILFSTSGTPTSGTTPAIIALFVDATANAIATQYLGLRTSSNSNNGILFHVVPSGSTTARTYQIRIGGGNFQVNSGSSSRKFGGTASTFLIIAEIA